MKYKWIIFFLFFSFFYFISIQVKANVNYEVQYFFQDEEDYVLNDEIDVYYNPYLVDDSYPEFVGYEFVEEEVEDNIFKLYYKIKYYDVTIYGNGGLTTDLKTSVVIARVKHGSNFVFNLMNYKDLFSYEGYELIKFERNFDNRITVYNDININCIWQPQTTYKFIIDNKDYLVNQVKGNVINLPNLLYHEYFIGWFDQDNKLINEDLIINETNNLNIYGKYLFDFIDIYTNQISINKNDFISFPRLFDGTSEINVIEEDEIYSFLNLIPNKNYNLKIKLLNEEINIDLNTREEILVFKYDNKIIYNSNYKYYLFNYEVSPNEGLIDYDENLVVKYNDEILNSYTEIDANLQGNLITLISSHAVSVKLDAITEYYFLDECNRTEEKDGFVYFYNLNPNMKYYFIYKLENEDVFYALQIYTLDLNVDLYDNKIVIHNAKTYQISYLGTNYEPNSNDEIIIDNLKSNQEYEIVINHNSFSYNVYFKTNSLITNFKDYSQYVVGHNYIYLEDLPTGYKYYLNKEGYNPIEGNMNIYNLMPNTEYSLYCLPINSINKVGELFLNFKTLKTPSKYVEVPIKNVDNIIIEDIYIRFKNNPLYEYSVDKVNWISGIEEKLNIINLTGYTDYVLYIRSKATEAQEASKVVVVFSFKTMAEAPSTDSFVDLNYTDSLLSFTMKDGYNYYFNGELIKAEGYFEIDGLDKSKECNLKVERISDLLAFNLEIVLRELGELTEMDKEVEVIKTFSSVKILNSKSNLTYLLYLNNIVVANQKGNNNELLFSELTENKVYKLVIKKDYDQQYFYEEEYISDVYLPGNIKQEIDDYLLSINRKWNPKIEKIIADYAEEINKTSDAIEFQKIVEDVKIKIDNIYRSTNLVIGLFGLFFSLLLIILAYFGLKVSKKH